MYRMLTILCVLAAAMAAPAPKPVVVYPPVYQPQVYHPQVYPPVYHPPVVAHAPLAVSHVSTVLGHPPVLPYRTVLPSSPYVF